MHGAHDRLKALMTHMCEPYSVLANMCAHESDWTYKLKQYNTYADKCKQIYSKTKNNTEIHHFVKGPTTITKHKQTTNKKNKFKKNKKMLL